jgi:hypothetical protein
MGQSSAIETYFKLLHRDSFVQWATLSQLQTRMGDPVHVLACSIGKLEDLEMSPLTKKVWL